MEIVPEVWAYVTWASYYSGRLLIQLQGPNQVGLDWLVGGLVLVDLREKIIGWDVGKMRIWVSPL